MKKYFVVVFLLSFINFYAQQEVCESPDESIVDLNSITKCTIEPVENSKEKGDRQIKVKISASKKRYLKKRVLRKEKAQAISSVNTLNVNEVSVSEGMELTGVDKIEETSDYKKNLARLTAKLSKEELSKAEKLFYVEKVPAFDKCKRVKKNERLDCFNIEMVKHINKHFHYPGEAVRNKIQGEVWVRFIIDKDGYVTNIKTLGPEGGEILNEEAKRVVSKLPRFEPGKNNGKRVAVKYGFPINFSLEE
ncbi:energy transducer TonB [Tenacibaculum tangerinum]|uniref:Energy transducer TonB n=1 Tax=Tenacibaculum tangerinum TaxID=3038772 RepID=A0ABY8L0S9_9FLAO|nr:energy transducer TonB [Tenacibaculum tangerinum]WGH74899.1 energy transducer TonB [Tenacibaculum tangerinum]